MNYTINQLRIFLKISQTKSITLASKELHLTQPAVSIQLRNFQDQFELPLTETIGRQIYITDFGKEIAEAAENILNQVHAINYKAKAYQGQLTGKLKLSIVSTGIYIMPFFLRSFLEKHPEVELEMDVTNKSKVIDSLEKNEVDFSLVSIIPENLKLHHLNLLENKLYLIGNGLNKLKKPKNQKLLFKELPLIFRENGSGTRQTMERFIEKYHLPVEKKIELSTNEAVKQAILANLGYSIMPLIGSETELENKKLQIVPVKGLPATTNWSLIWLKDKKLSPVAKAYIEHINSHKEEITQEHFGWISRY